MLKCKYISNYNTKAELFTCIVLKKREVENCDTTKTYFHEMEEFENFVTIFEKNEEMEAL